MRKFLGVLVGLALSMGMVIVTQAAAGGGAAAAVQVTTVSYGGSPYQTDHCVSSLSTCGSAGRSRPRRWVGFESYS